ncbi:MAG: SYNERG-CTERM sorting domain-containing protein [Synergistaceae bacterium]|nr:SYNERG-CTERM sorting domain-containing protein [Synergistaceae bacterium]
MKKYSALLVAMILVTMVFASSAFAGDTYVYTDSNANVGVLVMSNDTLTVQPYNNSSIDKANLGNQLKVFANSKDHSYAFLAGKNEIVKVKASGDVVYTDSIFAKPAIGEVGTFDKSGDIVVATGADGVLVSPDEDVFTSPDTALKAAVALPDDYASDSATALVALNNDLNAWIAVAGNAFAEEINKFLTALNGTQAWTANSEVTLTPAITALFARAAGAAAAEGSVLALRKNGNLYFAEKDTDTKATINNTFTSITDMLRLNTKFYLASSTGVKSGFGASAMAAGFTRAANVENEILQLANAVSVYKKYLKTIAESAAVTQALTALTDAIAGVDDLDTTDDAVWTEGNLADLAEALAAATNVAAGDLGALGNPVQMLALGALVEDTTFSNYLNEIVTPNAVAGLVAAVTAAIGNEDDANGLFTGELDEGGAADAVAAVTTAVNAVGAGVSPAFQDGADIDITKADYAHRVSLAHTLAALARNNVLVNTNVVAAVQGVADIITAFEAVTTTNVANVVTGADVAALVNAIYDNTADPVVDNFQAGVAAAIAEDTTLITAVKTALTTASTSAADVAKLVESVKVLAKSSTLTGTDALDDLKDLAEAIDDESFAAGNIEAMAADEANSKIYMYAGGKVYVRATTDTASKDITGTETLSFTTTTKSLDMVASDNYLSFIDDNGLSVYKIADNAISLVDTADGIVSIARLDTTLGGSDSGNGGNGNPAAEATSLLSPADLGDAGTKIVAAFDGATAADFLTAAADVTSKDGTAATDDVKAAIKKDMDVEDDVEPIAIKDFTVLKTEGGYLLVGGSDVEKYSAKSYKFHFVLQSLLAAEVGDVLEAKAFDANGDAATDAVKYVAGGKLDAGTYTLYATKIPENNENPNDNTGGSSSGGGCNAGFAGLAALAALALIKKSK